MKTTINFINYLNLFSALLLTATTIFEFVEIPFIMLPLYLFFGSYILEFFLEKKWKGIKLDETRVYFLLMFIFFLLAILYYPFDSETFFKKLLERRYALGAMAFIGFFGLNNKYKISYFFNTFILTAVLVIIYLIFFRIGITKFLTTDTINTFTEARIRYVNAHMGFNLFLDISLVGIWYLLKFSWGKIKQWKRIAYIFSALLFIGILSISEGRAGFIITIFLIFIFIGIEIYEKSKLWAILFFVLVPFLFTNIIEQHNRVQTTDLKDPRIFLWKASYSVIQESPLIGFGMSRAQERFDEEILFNQSAEEFKQFLNIKGILVDSHNQFLQTMMEFGLAGLILLCFLFVYPFFIVDKKQKWLAFFLLILCVNQSMFNPFITGRSSLLFGLILLLLLRTKKS